MGRAEREHDVVLLGATGYTGSLTAEHLARNAGGARWAIAGRARSRLEALRERLTAVDPAAAQLPLLVADVDDPPSLRRVAQSTKVLATTVGPYLLHGEPVVAACAAAGTHYVDLTGEPEFVDRVWLRHHDQARRTGAKLVHSCGFDSIPADLGVLHAVLRLPEGEPIQMQGFVRAAGTISGGTFQSALQIMGRLGPARELARRRAALEGRPDGRRVRGLRGLPRHDPSAGGWLLSAPTIDPITVLRSARALPRYGPDFSYAHYLVVKRAPVAAGLVAGAGAITAAAQIGPVRDALARFRRAGDGPTEAQRERGWFRVRLEGQAPGARVVTEVAGGDPGYGETSKMLGQAALCLATDELADGAGQLTTAAAMGQALIGRLERVGIEFRTIA
ncbi:MAG: saccharopine dehydrogenase family protein [Solirubrobacteraceae bacterium]